MKINSNVEVEQDDGGVWLIICGREHEFMYRSEARKLKKALEKMLAKKPIPREKRQRQ